MLESTIEARFCEAIQKRGGRAYKFVSPGRPNVPDRLVVMPHGVCWFAEIKAPGKKPSAAQVREHNRLRALGFYVYVIDSVEQVKECWG